MSVSERLPLSLSLWVLFRRSPPPPPHAGLTTDRAWPKEGGCEGEGIPALTDTGGKGYAALHTLDLVRTGGRVVSRERRRMRTSCCSGWDFVPL